MVVFLSVVFGSVVCGIRSLGPRSWPPGNKLFRAAEVGVEHPLVHTIADATDAALKRAYGSGGRRSGSMSRVQIIGGRGGQAGGRRRYPCLVAALTTTAAAMSSPDRRARGVSICFMPGSLGRHPDAPLTYADQGDRASPNNTKFRINPDASASGFI
jgi:hypothetical protein